MREEGADNSLIQEETSPKNEEYPFLSLFHPDPIRAQSEYRSLRLRLKKMCECRGIAFTEEFVKKTLEIVVREHTNEKVAELAIRIAQRVLNELRQEDFDRLMARLDSNPDQAGIKYESIRIKLIRVFRSRNCRNPDELADQCLDRLARRLATTEVRDLSKYARQIAEFVLHEYWRVPEEDPVESDSDLDAVALSVGGSDYDGEPSDETEARMHALDACLDQLEKTDRELMLTYHDVTPETKVYLRKRLAHRIGVTMDALRVQAFRIRQALEDCVNRRNESRT